MSLQLVAGRLDVVVTEAADAVHIAISGAKARGCERRKMWRFMYPIVDAFRDDPRPFEISSPHAQYTGRVEQMAGVGWVAFTRPVEAQR